jgi:S-adenosylmethionine-diacylglycerol 3-amino-3-carboxypropyl transferase
MTVKLLRCCSPVTIQNYAGAKCQWGFTESMTLAADIEHSSQLLSSAVHRSAGFSIDGLLERAFTYAFSGLVYPQIWEDPLVDLKAMKIEPQHHIVTIASGGCNALSYLTADPARVTAVDLNHAHVALVKLKIASLKFLPDWHSFYSFFGAADEANNIALFDRYLRGHLDEKTLRYWDKSNWLGNRRITQFRKNFYRYGLLGRFIGAGHLITRLYGKDISKLVECKTVDEQRQVFDSEIAPLFEKKTIQWLVKQRASLFGLGIPPAQYDALAGGEKMVDILKQRLEKVACGFLIQDNYFAWQAFARGYAPDGTGALPPYLQEENFAALRDVADRLDMQLGSVTDVLVQAPRGGVDRVVLLDAQDWMTDQQLNELWSAITKAAAPRARVIFRTAGVETILPGRVAHETLCQWNYLAAESLTLGQQDRSGIYGGFHIYEFNA